MRVPLVAATARLARALKTRLHDAVKRRAEHQQHREHGRAGECQRGRSIVEWVNLCYLTGYLRATT